MKLTLSEMNILSTILEKRKAKLQEGTISAHDEKELQIIEELQKRLVDMHIDLSVDEKRMISSLLQQEQAHIRGNEMEEYQTIQNKLE